MARRARALLSLALACRGAALSDAPGGAKVCAGELQTYGSDGGFMQMIAAAENIPGSSVRHPEVRFGGQVLEPKLGSRTYFGTECDPGRSFRREEYGSLKLLGKRVSYRVNMAEVGCGCATAVHLHPMRENSDPGKCSGDHFCDAIGVCGTRCAEIDIQQANRHVWFTALHTFTEEDGPDVRGVHRGLGGTGADKRRDWSAEDYGPHGRCVDTRSSFLVEASFPTDPSGRLLALEVGLSQSGKPCNLTARIDRYELPAKGAGLNRNGLAELEDVLRTGVTPVVSYWQSNHLLWLEGSANSSDAVCPRGPGCGDTFVITDFSVESLGGSRSSARVVDDAAPLQMLGQPGMFSDVGQSVEPPVADKDGLMHFQGIEWAVSGCPMPDPPTTFDIRKRAWTLYDRYEALANRREMAKAARNIWAFRNEMVAVTPWGSLWGTARRNMFSNQLEFFDCNDHLVATFRANFSWFGIPVGGSFHHSTGDLIGHTHVDTSGGYAVIRVQSSAGDAQARMVHLRRWLGETETVVTMLPPETGRRLGAGGFARSAVVDPLVLSLFAATRFGTNVPPVEITFLGCMLLFVLPAFFGLFVWKAFRKSSQPADQRTAYLRSMREVYTPRPKASQDAFRPVARKTRGSNYERIAPGGGWVGLPLCFSGVRLPCDYSNTPRDNGSP